MKMIPHLLVLLPCLAMLLSACEIKKDAKSMLKTTRRVEDSSRHLEKRTDDLVSDMTYDRSDSVMTERLERLFGERAADNLGPYTGTYEFFFGLKDEADLCKASEVLVRAMWWQFWKGDYNDTIAELDSRLQLTYKSMFATLYKHTPHNGNVDPWWPRPDRSFRGIAALGTALDLVSRNSHKALSSQGLKDSIFYDVMIEALRNRKATVRNEQFPLATAEVLRWENEAIYLLQLRHNALPLMAAMRMTNLLERGDVSRLYASAYGQDVDLSLANPEKLKEWTLWMDKAAKTRADLKSMGIEPQYNTTIAKTVARVNFGQKAILARPPGVVAASERAPIEARFASTYTKVADQAFPPEPPPVKRAPRPMPTLNGKKTP